MSAKSYFRSMGIGKKHRYETQKLSFLEENHIYFMNDVDGKLKNDWKSVSKVLKCFYEEFDADNIAQKKSKGDNSCIHDDFC